MVHVQTNFLVNNQWLVHNLDINGCDSLVDQRCPVRSRGEVIYRKALFQIPAAMDVTEIQIKCTGDQFFPLWCARIPVTLGLAGKIVRNLFDPLQR